MRSPVVLEQPLHGGHDDDGAARPTRPTARSTSSASARWGGCASCARFPSIFAGAHVEPARGRAAPREDRRLDLPGPVDVMVDGEVERLSSSASRCCPARWRWWHEQHGADDERSSSRTRIEATEPAERGAGALVRDADAAGQRRQRGALERGPELDGAEPGDADRGLQRRPRAPGQLDGSPLLHRADRA